MTVTSAETDVPGIRRLRLRDGSSIAIRRLAAADCSSLQEYLADVPGEERVFLRQDLSVIVERWCEASQNSHVLPLVACDGERVVGDAVLYQDPGVWSARLGKLRLFVHPTRRGQGVGTGLVCEVVDLARERAFDKLVAECAGEQAGLIKLLQGNGFEERVRLPDFLCDRSGRRHDLVWMVHDLDVARGGDSPSERESIAGRPTGGAS